MHFKDGKLVGSYQTYYKNGQIREDVNKQPWVGTGNSEYVDWNTVYDESGNIIRKFFALGNTKNIIEHHFENGKRKEFVVNNFFRINFSNSGQMGSVHYLRNYYPSFGYDLFSNQQLRKVHFASEKNSLMMCFLICSLGS